MRASNELVASGLQGVLLAHIADIQCAPEAILIYTKQVVEVRLLSEQVLPVCAVEGQDVATLQQKPNNSSCWMVGAADWTMDSQNVGMDSERYKPSRNTITYKHPTGRCRDGFRQQRSFVIKWCTTYLEHGYATFTFRELLLHPLNDALPAWLMELPPINLQGTRSHREHS